MDTFKIWGSSGKEGELRLGEVTREGSIIKVEVIKLKVGSLLIENESAELVFTDKDGAILNFSRELNKALRITKFQKAVDYIWKNSGMDRIGYLYKFTSEFKINYCE